MSARLHYGDIWQAVADALPDRVAVEADGEVTTYRELARRAGQLSAVFREAGVRAGDKVAIFLYNRPEYLVALFACLATGVAPVPVNFRYRAGEVDELLADSGAVAVIFPASLEHVVRDVRAPAVRLWLRVGDTAGDTERDTAGDIEGGEPGPPVGAVDFAEIERYAPSLPERAPAGGELLLYTGGTTGRPKAVVWDVGDLLTVQLYSIYDAIGLTPPGSLDGVVEIAASPSTPRLATMPLAPLMHGTALFNSMNTLVLGGSVVVVPQPGFDPHRAVRIARDRRVTRLIVAGDAVAAPLVDAAGDTGLPDVRTVISSGMRFSDDVKARLHGLGELTIIDLLASTEGGPYAVALSRRAEDLPARLRLFPDAVVLDDRDDEVQDRPGARGVLGYRGALPKGYHRAPEKTAETFRWIRGVRYVAPGDLVDVKGDGEIELLGRGSSVVNTGGEKVYPVEVEEALLSHPDVVDAVVFGLPDRRFGEVVAAVVATIPGSRVDEDELRAHVGALIAGYKKPRVVDIRPALDRTPTGKVDMRRLRRELTAERTR